MKHNYFTLIFLLFSVLTFAQTHLYENPNFEAIAKDHKIIAVVPFKTSVSLRPRQMKEISKEQLEKMEMDEGENIQKAMYTWFLKREKRGTLLVKVQDPATTTALLRKENINYTNITDYTPRELAEILDVDAVISGTFETNQPMSEGASVALGLLVGFWGATNKAVINLSIHNRMDGELLINYNKAVRGSIGSSTDALINTLMRKASRRIAYTK
ncbi:hypothetical protein ED312_19290 [Sinomicrobium pectinilyticum]|uniref:Secreted protein n=1 Tax=Sinomicrobium pectinilyticum TaxID=1084421 RepID=A0A3N0DRX1_SINP1|nr:hypothetical protein [Sinomicrobium pectinilyticum]RNL78226.1 hypothetical protein ED312_19290 [Sinomicrobium pectinilyticum]